MPGKSFRMGVVGADELLELVDELDGGGLAATALVLFDFDSSG